MRSTPEGKIKTEIKKILKDKNIYYHMVNSSGLGSTGFPDFLLIISGVVVTIEAKADAKRAPTIRQQFHMKRLREAGATTLLIHKDNIKYLEGFLERFLVWKCMEAEDYTLIYRECKFND